MSTHSATKGFTLVELSIVIIIVGLIVTGVIGGQRLIQQAKLRTLISDKTDVETAVNNFRIEFRAVPGDMRNADSFWPACGGSANACNGDGNKHIDYADGNDAADESYTAWTHLANSGHYPGAFTGDSDATSKAGVTVPEASFKQGVVITLLYDADLPSDPTFFSGNVILFGGATGAATLSDVPFLLPSQAMSVDAKIDDGQPDAGRVFALDGSAASCINTGEYNVVDTYDSGGGPVPMDDVTAQGCAMVFALGN
ncbi:MAG: prepilin-type N-terminal cleavage/methylation domain-containing protein [Rickettsiales bacterium]